MTVLSSTRSNRSAAVALIRRPMHEGLLAVIPIIVVSARDVSGNKEPARLTVLHNGVLVQNNVSLKGGTTYIGAPSYRPHADAPLRLQDHSHEVRFRNIWLRKL